MLSHIQTSLFKTYCIARHHLLPIVACQIGALPPFWPHFCRVLIISLSEGKRAPTIHEALIHSVNIPARKHSANQSICGRCSKPVRKNRLQCCFCCMTCFAISYTEVLLCNPSTNYLHHAVLRMDPWHSNSTKFCHTWLLTQLRRSAAVMT